MRPGSSSVSGSTLALQRGQRLQRADGEGDVQRQRHPGGEQAVAAEQRHEPGRTGGDEGPPRVGRVDDAQRFQVAHAAPQRWAREVSATWMRVRGMRPPSVRSSTTTPSRKRASMRRFVDDGLGDHLGGPLRPGRDHDFPGQRALLADGVARGMHEQTPRPVGPGVEQVAPRRASVERLAVRRAALLDREQVGEVGADPQSRPDHGGFAADVAQRDHIAHALADGRGSRSTSIVLSACPGMGGRRSTKRADVVCASSTDSGCGASPSMRSCHCDRIRVSR